MPLSRFDLIRVKDVLETMLAQLDLEAFLFAVEHTDHGWELRVECATEDGWQIETIHLGEQFPDASEGDAPLRTQMLTLLQVRLALCKRHGRPGQ
jgi:hypothetical protein